jgi:P-type Cu2+ transporter
MDISSCSLCGTELPRQPIIDQLHSFCCMGCHAVFNILSSKGQLANFEDSSVFRQAVRSGLISNPALIDQIKQNQLENSNLQLEKFYVEVSDLWCPSCADVIKWMLLKEKGIKNCVVDYATDLASIEYSPRYISKENILKVITSLGYPAEPLENLKNQTLSFSLYLRFVIAVFCALNLMMFSYPLYATYFDSTAQEYGNIFAWLSFYTSFPLIYCLWPIFRRFIHGIRVGMLGMESLVLTGVCTAFGLSVYELLNGGTKVYFDSMSVIITFMLLGKIIESKAKFSAKDSLLRMTRANPCRARKRDLSNNQTFVPIKEIQTGDIVIVLTGEKIPLDGIVIEGEGACDESLMTGESLPVSKKNNSKVLGGALLQHGWLAIQVTAILEHSALRKILEIVEVDIGHKTSYVRSADQIVHWFVPFVVTISLITCFTCLWLGINDEGKTVGESAMIRAISILLISCPCAIGIAAPLAESNLLNSLAKLGAIVRNRGCLPILGTETAFAFDKTGTITEGNFRVLSGLKELDDSMLNILKGLASQSTHPISVAVSNAIDVQPVCLEKIEEFAGKGLRGFYEKDIFYLGSEQFLEYLGILVPEKTITPFENQIASQVIFSKNGETFQKILLGDKIRKSAFDLVEEMAPAKLLIISGDSKGCVESVARACQFSQWRWGCNPLEKREIIESLRKKGHVVCFVGDGINDAPALTAADIGISVVTASDISIQVSDILLTTDQLLVIPQIRALAKKGQRIIKQNLFWAFFYNIIGIGLAAFGFLSPIFATFAMVISSLMVLFNSKRICTNVQ